ncbi:MULE transposase domain - like 6 [Theobroma cacao]|nr:MULE transposase domain - like 6 [Theobroma cacao]
MSCQARFVVACKDKACKFSVHAMKLLEGEYWHVRTFHEVPMCTVDGLQGVALRPKDINGKMQVQWGLECLYGRLTKRRSMRKTCFQSLGGVISTITLWLLIRHNNSSIIAGRIGLVSRGSGIIGHVEDEDSWTWFLSKLHDTSGCPKNTMFMFDQHLVIKKVIQSAYPEAHHDLCFYHSKQNFKNKFKHDDISMIFTPAREYYKLKQIHARAHFDLMRINPKRWACAGSLTCSNIGSMTSTRRPSRRPLLSTLGLSVINVTFPLCFNIEFIRFLSKCKREAVELCVD